MRITDVQINTLDANKLKAFVNIEFDNAMIVKGFKIIDGQNGLFVTQPSEKGNNGKYYKQVYYKRDGEKYTDNAKKIKNAIQKKVLEKYDELNKEEVVEHTEEDSDIPF